MSETIDDIVIELRSEPLAESCRVVAKIQAPTLAKNIISSEIKKLQNIMIEE